MLVSLGTIAGFRSQKRHEQQPERELTGWAHSVR